MATPPFPDLAALRAARARIEAAINRAVQW
jgi:hypothetical protein